MSLKISTDILAQHLRTAAARYEQDAAVCASDKRLFEQFCKQQKECLEIADALDDHIKLCTDGDQLVIVTTGGFK